MYHGTRAVPCLYDSRARARGALYCELRVRGASQRRPSRSLPERLATAIATAMLHPLPLAHSEYRQYLPNGDVVPGTRALGHANWKGGGKLNPFGKAFRDAGYRWTRALCEADSDGDGEPNGLELGDPCCAWTLEGGRPPLRSWRISHPGCTGTEYNALLGHADVVCVSGMPMPNCSASAAATGRAARGARRAARRRAAADAGGGVGALLLLEQLLRLRLQEGPEARARHVGGAAAPARLRVALAPRGARRREGERRGEVARRRGQRRRARRRPRLRRVGRRVRRAAARRVSVRRHPLGLPARRPRQPRLRHVAAHRPRRRRLPAAPPPPDGDHRLPAGQLRAGAPRRDGAFHGDRPRPRQVERGARTPELRLFLVVAVALVRDDGVAPLVAHDAVEARAARPLAAGVGRPPRPQRALAPPRRLQHELRDLLGDVQPRPQLRDRAAPLAPLPRVARHTAR